MVHTVPVATPPVEEGQQGRAAASAWPLSAMDGGSPCLVFNEKRDCCKMGGWGRVAYDGVEYRKSQQRLDAGLVTMPLSS